MWITIRIIFYIRSSRLFSVYFKKHGENTDNPLIRIYVNVIENRITFRIKSGYYRELSTSETMNLLERTENEITKDKNGENIPHLEVTEALFSTFQYSICNAIFN